jgi:LmbE family N-acetylglucosaminyl deacetylase
LAEDKPPSPGPLPKGEERVKRYLLPLFLTETVARSWMKADARSRVRYGFPDPIFTNQWAHPLRIPILILLVFQCLTPRSLSQSQNLAIDRGAMGMAQALGRLPLTSRAMFIAAHPDDETAGVLPYLSRGLHAQTAVLTLTRGEGGQNLISSDLFDALGLLRTGELLAADEYYGVRQYFTRAFDFGFSKSSDETLQKWDRTAVLNDMVRAIRSFRPDIIVSFWQGNSKDGHGHHQASGILAREAYRLAGDSQQFPELARQGLSPWRARKLYIGNLQATDTASFSVDVGEFAPLLGLSFQQIGTEGYSLHRSQGYGNSYAAPGSHRIRYRLIDPAQPDTGFFDHLDVTLTGLIQRLGSSWNLEPSWLKQEASVLETSVQQAQTRFSPSDFSAMIEPLITGLVALRQIRDKITDKGTHSPSEDTLRFLLADKEEDFTRALDLATGVAFEALADDALVTPGQTFGVTAAFTNQSKMAVRLKQIELQPAGGSRGWKIERGTKIPENVKPSERVEIKFRVSVPLDDPPTEPHWKRMSRSETMYSVSDQDLINNPLPNPVLTARVDYVLGAGGPHSTSTGLKPDAGFNELDLSKNQPVEFLDRDVRKGAHRVPILVVPELSVTVTPPTQLIPLKSASQRRLIQIELTNNSPSSVAGQLAVGAPSGWSIEPSEQPFSISRENETAVFRFEVKSDGTAPSSKTSFAATARARGKEFSFGYQMISVLDLWKNPLYRRAETAVTVWDVQTPPELSVGYIMGAGDNVAETLSQLGPRVRLLEAEDLASGNLGQYSCLIAGIRAYDVRQDLIANNRRLLAYVKNGGVYIVQYNTPSAWNKVQYSPYPAKIHNSDRVTDESAPVTILDPDHRVFNFPNKITQKDFDGWVQERGLYFIQDRDPQFKPLLSCHDPGDPPLDGGLLIAPYGKGLYILTSLSWFRQLPEGVPGAIRIFANLISLGAPRQ